LSDVYLRPGPMLSSEECLEELGKPVFAHRGPRFRKIYMEIISKVGEVLSTEGRVVPVCASGSGGVEFMLVNLLHPEDRVLCLVNGHFSERLYRQAQVYSRDVEAVTVPWGNAVTPEEVEEILSGKPFDVVGVVSCETSTGAWTDIEGLSRVCRENGCMLLVDDVSGVGNPYYMDRWGVDATVTTTHESFACPPGFAVVAFSERAVEKASKTPRRSMYFDLTRYLRFQDERREPPFTVPSTLAAGLNRTLDRILGEGLENFFKRCGEMAKTLRGGLQKLGLTLFTSPSAYSNTCTAAYAPFNAAAFIEELKKYGVEVAPGKGRFREEIFRVGHSGVVTMDEIKVFLDAVEKIMDRR